MNAAERKATQSIHNRYSVAFPYSMTKYFDSKNVITSIVSLCHKQSLGYLTVISADAALISTRRSRRDPAFAVGHD